MRSPLAWLIASCLAGCSCSDGGNSTSTSAGGQPGTGATSSSGGSSGSGGTGGSATEAGTDAAGDADSGPSFDCQHAPVTEDCKSGWCRIPAGCFVMGSPKDEWGRGANTENQVKVTLTHPFLIQQKETSQADWVALGLKNPSAPPAKPGDGGDCLEPACPVGNVTWFEAAGFANLLSQKEGLKPCYVLEGCTGQLGEGMACTKIGTTAPTYYQCEGYRLPGEAEWEYAARAGTTTAFYTGPIKTLSDLGECAEDPNLASAEWYCFNSGGLTGSVTHPGGLKKKNPWGLFDTLGNTYEWTNDPMKGLGYGTVPLVDPWGTVQIKDPIEAVVLRGCGPITFSSRCRAAAHFAVSRPSHAGGLGFRLVRSLLATPDASTPDASLPDASPPDASTD